MTHVDLIEKLLRYGFTPTILRESINCVCERRYNPHERRTGAARAG